MTKDAATLRSGRELRPSEREALLSDTAELVASSHLFRSLDADGKRELVESAYVCSFPQGEWILREGEPGNTMYVVLRGAVRVETTTDHGVVVLAELGRGACFGEVSVLSGTPRTASVVTTTPTDCAAFERQQIEATLSPYPAVRDLLQTIVERRAEATIEKLVRS